MDVDRFRIGPEVTVRIQLALNVADLEAAVAFYSRMFGTPPAKCRPGYANFEISQPPLKLVLFEAPGAGGTINHLGVEVDDPAEVTATEQRWSATGLGTTPVVDAVCCYAHKTEAWTTDPDGLRWEVYVKRADAETMGPPTSADALPERPGCCGA